MHRFSKIQKCSQGICVIKYSEFQGLHEIPDKIRSFFSVGVRRSSFFQPMDNFHVEPSDANG